ARNVLWFLLVFLGGVVFPLSSFPDGAAAVLGYLPSAALADGLRAVLQDGAPPPVSSTLTLLAWATASLAAAGRTFRWEWGPSRPGRVVPWTNVRTRRGSAAPRRIRRTGSPGTSRPPARS